MDQILAAADSEFSRIMEHLKGEYARLQIGRASAALVENLQVEVYGSKQPLKAVASISVPDAKTIQIQPWDKSQLSVIEKGIQVSDLHLTPLNDGVTIRLNIPALTEERRKDLSKVVNRLAEDSRIAVRHGRQKAHDEIKSKEKTSLLTEDQAKLAEKKLQEKVDRINGDIEHMAKNKEKDVMTV